MQPILEGTFMPAVYTPSMTLPPSSRVLFCHLQEAVWTKGWHLVAGNYGYRDDRSRAAIPQRNTAQGKSLCRMYVAQRGGKAEGRWGQARGGEAERGEARPSEGTDAMPASFHWHLYTTTTAFPRKANLSVTLHGLSVKISDSLFLARAVWSGRLSIMDKNESYYFLTWGWYTTLTLTWGHHGIVKL